MGVEQIITEAGRADGRDADFVADADEADGRDRKRERHQGGTEGVVADAVLFGDAQGVVAGAQFGIAWPAAGDDELRCAEIAVAGFDAVAVAVVVLAVDGNVVVWMNAAGSEAVMQGSEDAARAFGGEYLPLVFFFGGDAASGKPVQHLPLIVAGERGADEGGVVAVVGLGAEVQVGVGASATTGDADFCADVAVVFEEADAQAARGGVDGAVAAGSAAADDDGVVGVGHGLVCE